MRRALLDVEPLRASPAFRRLLIGRTVSTLGGMMTMVAVMYQMWALTHSTVWTGAVGVAQAVPLIAFGLFAGALVDRGDRRRIYLLAVSGQALCALLLAAQGFAGRVPPVLVLALLAAQSCCSAVGGPAAGTFLPRLLPKERVAAGLALQQISGQVMMLAGPAVGGLVLGWTGVGGCYLVDAVTFLAAFHGAFGLPPMPADGSTRPGARGVLDGLRFLTGHPVVRAVLLTDLAAMVLALPVSLMPLLNAERFGGDPRTLGLFLSAVGVGGVVMSAFSGTFTRLPRPGLVMLCGSTAWGVTLGLLGVVRQPWVDLALLALAGAADTVAVVCRSVVVRSATPDRLLGRVVAAEQIVGQAGADAGNLRAGVVARWSSGPFALLSGGVLCVLAVALVGVFTPQLRHGEPAAPAEPVPPVQPAGA